jgi:hypothetical protein
MSLSITDISAPQLRKAAAIKEKIDQLQKELTNLLGSDERLPSSAFARRNGKEPRRRMSAAARRKIAAAARLRWKKAKAAGKNTL